MRTRLQNPSRYFIIIMMVLAGFGAAPALSDGHSANQKGQSAFSKAVQAIKEKNYRDGLSLFMELAEAGDHEAQYNVAVLLRSGKGRPQNYADALFWARLSQLGQIEQAADLVDQLEDKVIKGQLKTITERVKSSLMDKIDAGFIDSIPQLARFHIELLEEPDYASAYMWYTVATALDIPEMLTLRDDMEDELDAEQIADMQARATEMFDRILNGQSIQPEDNADES